MGRDGEETPADALAAAGVSRRGFRLFWAAVSTSQLGDAVYLLAIPLIVYNLTGSASAMTLLYGLSVVPHLVFGIIGGAFADRSGRRSPIVSLMVGAGGLLTLFALALALDIATFWMFCIVALALGSIVAAINPCVEAAIPGLVGESGLLRANSRLETSRTFSVIAGPAIAGILVSLASGAVVVFANAMSFLAAGFMMSIVSFGLADRRALPAAAPPASRLLEQMREGLYYSWRSRRLRFGIVLSTLSNVALTGSFETLLVFLMRDHLRLSSALIGLCFAAGSFTALIVSLLIPRIQSWLGFATGICVSLIAIGAAALMAGAGAGLWPTVAAQCLFISAALMFNVYWRAYRQSVSPTELLGRVAGATRGVAYAGAAIGAWIAAAAVAADISVQAYLLLAGMVVIGLGVVGILVFRRLDLAHGRDLGMTASIPVLVNKPQLAEE